MTVSRLRCSVNQYCKGNKFVIVIRILTKYSLLFFKIIFTFQDYLPTSLERRVTVLADKRKQYTLFVSQYFHLRENVKHKPMFHQIQKDLNRMTLLYRRPEMVAVSYIVVERLNKKYSFLYVICCQQYD